MKIDLVVFYLAQNTKPFCVFWRFFPTLIFSWIWAVYYWQNFHCTFETATENWRSLKVSMQGCNFRNTLSLLMREVNSLLITQQLYFSNRHMSFFDAAVEVENMFCTKVRNYVFMFKLDILLLMWLFSDGENKKKICYCCQLFFAIYVIRFTYLLNFQLFLGFLFFLSFPMSTLSDEYKLLQNSIESL